MTKGQLQNRLLLLEKLRLKATVEMSKLNDMVKEYDIEIASLKNTMKERKSNG